MQLHVKAMIATIAARRSFLAGAKVSIEALILFTKGGGGVKPGFI